MVDLPRVVNQLDGSTCEGGNCGPSVGAMALDFATHGASRTTGATVRVLLGAPANTNCNGTYIQDVAAAVRRGWSSANVYAEDGTIMPWATVSTLLAEGRGVHLAVNYAAVRKYLPSLVGSSTFSGNHFWFAAGNWMCGDPLWDGRPLLGGKRAPSPVFRKVSSATLAKVAGAFLVNGKALGTGKAYIGWTKVQAGLPVPVPTPPGDVDMIFGDPVGQDWQPSGSRKPVRNAPVRAGTAPIVGYVEVGQTIRSEFELKTKDGNVWRLVKFKGKSGFILRADFTDLTKRGDPVDIYFQNYADRKTP